jgi:hypothetical protein
MRRCDCRLSGLFHPSAVTPDVRRKIVAALRKISQGAWALSDLYENTALNNVQPERTTRVFPMSIDDWASEVEALAEEWEK